MALMLNSCVYYEDPRASFNVSSNRVEPYEVIFFDNYSTEADDFFWDFGDGFTSTAYNPEHYYSSEGTYTVSLRAHSHHGGEDIVYMTIDVYYTDLEVTVAEWNSSFIPSIFVGSAEVTLYTSYTDWFNFTNPVATGYTNSYGVVIFTRLDPIRYYVDVYNAFYDNSSLGQEDISYVETDPLYKTELNTFIAWVDYYPPSKQQRTETMRIPYTLKSAKREYKKIDLSK